MAHVLAWCYNLLLPAWTASDKTWAEDPAPLSMHYNGGMSSLQAALLTVLASAQKATASVHAPESAAFAPWASALRACLPAPKQLLLPSSCSAAPLEARGLQMSPQRVGKAHQEQQRHVPS